MLLSILIPTYNRVNDLVKNVKLLISYIDELDCEDIEIIISDNCSKDETEEEIKKLINFSKCNISYYKQSENIGLEKNALFVLEQAIGKYVMYIGDDDFIHKNYLKMIIDIINDNNAPSVILNSILGIGTDNNIVGSRDVGTRTQKFRSSYLTASLKMCLGNQLSGLTFLRKETLDNYLKNNVDNIYLFVYFVGFNSIRGDLLYIKEYPVFVTEGAKKDWSYGYDGLLNDFFKNYKILFKNRLHHRILAEIKTLKYQPFRFLRYYSKGYKVFLKHYMTILKSENISLFTKIFYIPIIILIIIPIFLDRIVDLSIEKNK